MVYESELVHFPPGRVVLGVVAFCGLHWAGFVYLVAQAFSI
jgi:hypothetical protein